MVSVLCYIYEYKFYFYIKFNRAEEYIISRLLAAALPGVCTAARGSSTVIQISNSALQTSIIIKTPYLI